MLYLQQRKELLSIIQDLKAYGLLDCTGGALSLRLCLPKALMNRLRIWQE